MPAMEKGPFINAAAFCETTIIANDGTISLIRVIDTVTQTATGVDPPSVMPAFVVSAKLAIVLKAGETRGRYAIKLRPEAPDGRHLPEQEQAIQLDGGHSGLNLISDVQFAVELEGIYWFDVIFVAGEGEERLLTRVPLRIVYQPEKTPS